MGDDAQTIEYWFGDGDGHVTRWTSPSVQGSVLLDFDGDGRADDAMIDLDHDGRADIAALDLDDDGVAETRHRDDGSGLWSLPDPGSAPTEAGAAAAPAGAPSACPLPRGAAPGSTAPSAPGTATPAPDEAPRVTAVPAEPGQPARQAVIDSDLDGVPDVLLFDTDGDGTADGAVPTPASRAQP